jgi:concentrative nucleoside transporter, CNT family
VSDDPESIEALLPVVTADNGFRRPVASTAVAPQLTSLLGIILFPALACLISTNRRAFPWRTVLSGLAFQFVIAVLILKTKAGTRFFQLGGEAVNKINQFAGEGSRMVFGPLADSGTFQSGPVLAIVVAGTIILVAALSALLYHWGILQRVVQGMAWVMQRVMRTSGSESLAAAANVFMGQTEAPLLIKPYLARMTQSELMCMMTGGMATIAGGVAAVYAGFGLASGHADLAGHLLTASVISAPAAMMFAKILLPETEVSETAAGAHVPVARTARNSIDALCGGASDGMKLAINVLAMLIAFVAVVAMANWFLGAVQEAVGVAQPVKLEQFFGWINAPFAWLMGVPWGSDCQVVGGILGQRIVLNEFVGYLALTSPETVLSERAFNLATYALCGFANFSSIAIQIGGIGALEPSRRGDLARHGLRAMVGGLLACYQTAALVGLLL